MNDPLTIIPGRPDREIATDLRTRVSAALQPILALMEEAAQDGFTIQFNLNVDWATKRATLQQLAIVKHY